DRLGVDNVIYIGDIVHGQPLDHGSDASTIGIHQTGDGEPPGGEPPVSGKRLSQVSDAGDQHVSVLCLADCLGDLITQVFDLVTHSPDAVRAQMGKVFAQFGRIDARRLGQLQ